MDQGHTQTNQMLTALEKKLGKEYRAAKKSVQNKLTDYLSKFKKQDSEKAEKVKKGLLTQEEYTRWRIGKMATSKRWREMRDVLAKDLSNVNQIAMGIINGHTIDVYALNANYGSYEICDGMSLDLSFTLYDHDTVERLMRDDPEIIPKARVDIPKDMQWNRAKLTSAITQGILTGESIPDIAKRLGSVADMNRNAAIRNARTYTTAAENGGRVDSYKRAKAMGIDLKQEWMATLDMRTRTSHRHLDGEKIEVGGKFSNGCRYPGDPNGAPWEIYNCRCTLVAVDPMFEKEDAELMKERFSRLPKGMTYDEWKLDKEREASKSSHKIVDGKDITKTWNRRNKEFDFEIEDIINAQGFDGLPRIVSKNEFEEAVKAANGGNGFIAQRSYSAPDQEILDAYRDQLYHGKWYVDCSTGGAQYGQGMYCAADYTGTLSDGIRAEMDHYAGLGDMRNTGKTIYDLPAERQQELIESTIKKNFSNISESERDALRKMIDFEVMHTGDWKSVNEAMQVLTKSNINPMDAIMPLREYRTVNVSYTETLTLDPSARIISWRDLQDMRVGNLNISYREELIDKELGSMSLSRDERTFIGYNLGRNVSWEEVDAAARRLGNAGRNSAMEKVESIGEKVTKAYNEEQERRNEMAHIYQEKYKDLGSMAAGLGYDAINAEGHGQSGSYTVVLNRTKLIIKGE